MESISIVREQNDASQSLGFSATEIFDAMAKFCEFDSCRIEISPYQNAVMYFSIGQQTRTNSQLLWMNSSRSSGTLSRRISNRLFADVAMESRAAGLPDLWVYSTQFGSLDAKIKEEFFKSIVAMKQDWPFDFGLAARSPCHRMQLILDPKMPIEKMLVDFQLKGLL